MHIFTKEKLSVTAHLPVILQCFQKIQRYSLYLYLSLSFWRKEEFWGVIFKKIHGNEIIKQCILHEANYHCIPFWVCMEITTLRLCQWVMKNQPGSGRIGVWCCCAFFNKGKLKITQWCPTVSLVYDFRGVFMLDSNKTVGIKCSCH